MRIEKRILQPHWPSRSVTTTYSYVLLVLAAPLACRDSKGWTETRIRASVAEELVDGRIPELPPLDDSAKIMRVFRLPESLGAQFKLGFPVGLAGTGHGCGIAVGDVSDRAVHFFQTDGEYRRSLYGGGRDAAIFAGSPLGGIAEHPDGRVLAGTISGRVVIADAHKVATVTVDLARPSVPDTGGLGGNLAVGPDGLIYDHWFAGEQRIVRKADWMKDPALVRVYDSTGRLVRRIGRVKEYGGVALTHYLNRGVIRIHRDTLWFARRADAQVLAFPLRGPFDKPSRVVSLPLFFRPEKPIEFVSNDSERIAVRLQEQLRTFAIASDGDFIVVQHASWPPMRQRSGAFIPKSVLAVHSREGQLKRAFSLPGNIVALAGTGAESFAVVGIAGKLTVARMQWEGLQADSGPMRCSFPETSGDVAYGRASQERPVVRPFRRRQ